MIAECSGCLRAPTDAGGKSRVRVRVRWLALLPAVLAVLAPKCPMCLVAYLSAFGVTLGVATFALTVVRPLAIGLAALALVFTLRRAWLDREARQPKSRGAGSWIRDLSPYRYR